MKPTWHHANFALIDQGDAREGTMSVFLDYDIGNWTFGLRFEHDLCWYDIVVQVGPVHLSFCYWRVNMMASSVDSAGSEFLSE